MVTVAHCSEISQALLVKSLLESEGIPAFVPDELTASTAPPYMWSLGIRVQVAPEQAEAAAEVIRLNDAAGRP